MDKNMITKIHNYWNKTEFGKMMIKNNKISDSDLLFLIPNNKKKILGLPMTRLWDKRNKKKYRANKRKNIMTFKMFDILEKNIEQRFLNINFSDNFVNYKDLKFGRQ